MTFVKHCYAFIVLTVAFLASLPTGGQVKTPKVKPRPVLRLPYRWLLEKPSLSNPYSIGMFEDEINFFRGGLAATDWEGNIYVIDRQNFEIDFLKCFDKYGKFREFWEAFIWRGNIATTKDGYVWVPTSEEKITGLPIMVFRKGRKSPVADWRFSLSSEFQNKIEMTLKDKGFKWKTRWWICNIEGSADKVMMRFILEDPKSGKLNGYLKIIASSDGKKLLNVEVEESMNTILSANGDLWFYDSDFDIKHRIWSKIWLWKEGDSRGKPLIDRTRVKEPWGPFFLLGEKIYASDIYIDTKGNVYLIWERDAQKDFCRKFIVEGRIIIEYKVDVKALGNKELALIVLDKQKRLLTYLPWTHIADLESWENWIKPLPDGSGFYRIEYREREAVIYFHPLPK